MAVIVQFRLNLISYVTIFFYEASDVNIIGCFKIVGIRAA